MAAGTADEGPHFVCFARTLRIAFDDPTGLARLPVGAHGVVEGAPAQQAGGILQPAFVPGCAHVAVDELDLLDMVGETLAGVAGELLAEITQHLPRRVMAELAQVAFAPGALHRPEDGFESGLIGRADREIAARGSSTDTAAETAAGHAAGRQDRKSTRLKLQSPDHLVCRL